MSSFDDRARIDKQIVMGPTWDLLGRVPFAFRTQVAESLQRQWLPDVGLKTRRAFEW